MMPAHVTVSPFHQLTRLPTTRRSASSQANLGEPLAGPIGMGAVKLHPE